MPDPEEDKVVKAPAEGYKTLHEDENTTLDKNNGKY